LAEWSAVLQNVLANAWNAMLDAPDARVAFLGGRDRRGVEWLRISDTGTGLEVPIDQSAVLFEPFERRQEIDPDKTSIAIGGQGLGLAIVRMIAGRRSAKVAFVQPEPGFSTTIELSWKGGSA
jgi:C4-dicarboxylate-specific signal transduction histidine kinase